MITFYQTKHSINSIPVIFKDKMIGNHPCDGIKNYKLPKTESSLILDDGFFLYFNLHNVAHSIGQFIVSMYEYKQQKLYVSKCIQSMPFLEKLLYLYVDSFTLIEEETLYKCENMYIPTYCWFYYGYINHIYDSIHHTRIFYPISNNNPSEKQFYSFIDSIYEKYHMNYKKLDNICILKSQLSTDSTTPFRSMFLSKEVLNLLKKHNYILLFPHEIKDIIEYICILKSAKSVITSYGGAQCTNRFFFTNANVKVICNQHYEDEYKDAYHNSICVGKSLSTIFYLDIKNNITLEEMTHILNS
jgi:hypothetical protein